jgi:hypothetical protein
MTITRAQRAEILDHLVLNVLEQSPDGDLKKALDFGAHTDYLSLIGMSELDIRDLYYVENEAETHVLPGIKALVRVLQKYITYRAATGNPIGDTLEAWKNVTADDFNNFRASKEFLTTINSPTTAPSLTPAPRKPVTPLELFKKGIKRDPTYFPELRDGKYFDDWRRKTESQAVSQDVANVLNPDFVPGSTEERDLFQAQCRYLYSVFVQNIKTDAGKAIIREHEVDKDAQKVYKEILDHYLKSTKAMISSSELLAYITSAKLGNGLWKGNTESFILHWQNQVRLYEKQTESGDHFSGTQKKIMLQNAVHPVAELRQVKTTADQHKTHTGHTLGYEEYVDLLISASQAYDKQHPSKPATRRQVYSHEIENSSHDIFAFTHDVHDQYDTDDFAPEFDIDLSVDLISAYAHERAERDKKAGRVNIETWMKLGHDARKLWNSMSVEDRELIIKASKSSSNKPKSPVSSKDQSAKVHETVQVNSHEIDQQDQDNDDAFVDASDGSDDTNSGQLLLAAMKTDTKKSSVSPSDIRRVLSKSMSGNSGNRKFSANTHIVYNVAAHHSVPEYSLIDRGANGGIAGEDVRVIDFKHRQVDVQGIDDHQLNNVRIATVGGVINTQYGPVIAVFHQYAHTGKGTSIHSSPQLEFYKNKVSDRSIKVGGLQRIETLDGYIIPISIKNGLPRMQIRPFTNDEWEQLPHVVMTGDTTWDPSVLDYDACDDENWFDSLEEIEDGIMDTFDEFGNYRKRVQSNFHDMDPTDIEDAADFASYHAYLHKLNPNSTSPEQTVYGDPEFHDGALYFSSAHQHMPPELVRTTKPSENEKKKKDFKPPSSRTVTTRNPDYGLLRPLFGWLSVSTIAKTFGLTTQYGRIPNSTILKKHYKSPNPALNVQRRDEDVATDYVYSNTPAVDSGATGAQIFVGCKSQVTSAYGCKTDGEFVNTLEDEIRKRGAPNRLISDRAQAQISKKVQDILRTYVIGDWQSEPHQQHQNPAERRIQTVKTMTNTILDRTGAPADTWLLCLTYVCFLLNFTYCPSIDAVPIQVLTGSTPDISPLLRFHFYQDVYYKLDDSDFPSDSRELKGKFVGISENVGHAMTFQVLTDTRKVIHRSNLRPVTAEDPNQRLDLLSGEDLPKDPVIKSRLDDNSGVADQTKAPIFNPVDLVGRSFLLHEQENGERHRATIVEALEDMESDLEKNPTRIKFKCSINNEQYEDILTYAEVLEHIEKDEETEIVWKFRRITAHEGPLNSNHPNYKGSKYNVMIEWENGEITSEPLSVIAADDPVTCAIYAREHGLLDQDGWKKFKRIARREKKMLRMINQAKLRSYRHSPKYMFGYEVARNYEHGLELDKRNKNTKWQDCTSLEMAQLHEYKTFRDQGHNAKPPPGYRKIRVHLVYAVKHDGRHKARLVADGHLTEVPMDSVYSGVVSLRGLRLVIFLAELNGLNIWSTDIGNAYLESKTKEKVCFIAGKEFGELQGHLLIIEKALYGLRSSGARWHDKLWDCLRELGFTPSKAEPDIWMREVDGIYEYIACYVDDLAIASKDPETIAKQLQEKYGFKLKGTGNITYHLGMDFFRDETGTLCMAPRKYVEKLTETYVRHFGTKPSTTVTSPIEKGDHPELDTTEFLDPDDVTLYQSMIGALQWAVSIGRFDIQTAVMTLSSFRTAPRRGHMLRVRRIYGYLAKMRDATVRVRTDMPDYSDLPTQEYDWSRTVYGETTEEIPKDIPQPLGKPVRLSHYVDANLLHDLLTGKSVTGILHLVNQTPIDWYSKKQATVETATYGSEFVAARTCTDQSIDLRNTLRYLGVPVEDESYMFGDNKSVVDSSSSPHAKLHKRHTILSFHLLIFASNDVRLSVLVIRESSWDFLGNCMSVRDSYIKYGKL